MPPSPGKHIAFVMVTLKRGGIDTTYCVFLGGGMAKAGWKMPTARYRFSTQIDDEKRIFKVEHGLAVARDKTTTLESNGTLELDGTEGSERELDNNQFVRTIEQLTREHGQKVFYDIEQG
jgi:hypothetical protein